MKLSIKILGGLTLMLGLFSCENPNQKDEVKPFMHVADFQKIVQSLDSNTALVKRLEMAQSVETKQQSTTQWGVELKPFVNANFNRAIHQDDYLLKVDSAPLSGQIAYTYTSKKNDLPVQKATYRYQDDILIAAKLWVTKASKVYTLTEVLTYYPEVGYVIDNSQNLEMVRDESFFLSAYWEAAPQPWRMFFNIGEHNIPVNFLFSEENGHPQLTFVQGQEKITVSAKKKGDNWQAEMPVFNSYIQFQWSDNELSGTFHNIDRGPDYIIPFTAHQLSLDQYWNFVDNATNISGQWETYFMNSDGSKTPAIGIFNQIGSDVFGTFATETGDYRFLQGQITGDSFSLSTFDGSHLYLFTGQVNGQEISGKFYSGNHYQSEWSARLNNTFSLTDPDKMTTLTNVENGFDFTFPNLSGEMVSLSDARFQNKPVIIQLLGSWCPNCMDETRFFVDLYKERHTDGLEIIGIAFERSAEFEKAQPAVQKAIADLHVPYTVLIGGSTRNAASVLPMIDKIKSYPTSIFLDKNHRVVKVHTGFYGPGTGHFYTEYVSKTQALIDSLLIP